jgi:hypothetical protein
MPIKFENVGIAVRGPSGILVMFAEQLNKS